MFQWNILHCCSNIWESKINCIDQQRSPLNLRQLSSLEEHWEMVLVAVTVLEGLLDPVVVMYCLERNKIRSQHRSQGAITCMAKCHFYALQKSICCQIILPCLCPPRAIHATTLAFVKFRIILLFSVKDETRKTLFSCYLSASYQTGIPFSVSLRDHNSSPTWKGREERKGVTR